MRLNISFEHDADTGKERAVITDENGSKMPCVRAVELHYRYNELSEVKITLAVNRTDVTLGVKA